MKKIFSWILLCIGITAPVYAQKHTVPASVTQAFNTRFPLAKEVKWEKENSKEFEANFKLNSTNVSANFGLDGQWKETETTINANELPTPVANTVNTRYPGAVIIVAEKIEKPEGTLMYEVNIKVKGKKKELELMPDGNLVK